MANQLFNLLGGQQMQNPMTNIVNQFNQFRQSFQGDPKQRVQQLLNSGQMSQAQFNQLSQMATQFQNMLNQRQYTTMRKVKYKYYLRKELMLWL